MIIAVVGEKGGTGKSTIALNMVSYFLLQNKKVALLDADPQKSVLSWADIRRETTTGKEQLLAIARTGKYIDREAQALAQDYNIVIIDTGGKDSIEMRKSLLAADFIIIPILPGQFEAWSIQTTIELFAEAQSFNEKLAGAIVLNRVPFIPKLKEKEYKEMFNFINEVLEEMKDSVNNLFVCQNYLVERIDYKKTLSEGKGVVELENSKAKEEFIKLMEEILLLFKKLNIAR